VLLLFAESFAKKQRLSESGRMSAGFSREICSALFYVLAFLPQSAQVQES